MATGPVGEFFYFTLILKNSELQMTSSNERVTHNVVITVSLDLNVQSQTCSKLARFPGLLSEVWLHEFLSTQVFSLCVGERCLA